MKEGGGAEGECEKERALGVLLYHSLGRDRGTKIIMWKTQFLRYYSVREAN